MVNCYKNPNVKFVLYDTNTFISCSTTLTNDALKYVNNCMTCNLLHINLDKSCFMHFPHKTSSLNGHIKQSSESDYSDSYEYDIAESPKLSIGDTNISMVDEVKFLGVTFDRKLSWNAQTEALYKRLKCAIAISKRIKPYITNENQKQYILLSLSPTFYMAYLYGAEFLNIEWTK